MTTPPLDIRPATEDDCATLLELIKGLADYERLSREVVATETGLRETLFGERAYAEAVIGYAEGEPVGFALFFHTYSTFLAKPGLWLEDLFIKPELRRRGYGRALLSRVAAIAVERDCGRFEWAALDWNEPAVNFYLKLGAVPMDEWTTFRITGDALQRLGSLSTFSA